MEHHTQGNGYSYKSQGGAESRSFQAAVWGEIGLSGTADWGDKDVAEWGAGVLKFLVEGERAGGKEMVIIFSRETHTGVGDQS